MRIPRLGRIGAGTLWSASGLVLPLAAAMAAIPVLVRHLGEERFGILTLCWAMAGYFNLFDMGLGRALVLRIARLQGEGREGEVSRSFWTGVLALAAMGAALGIATMVASPLVVDRVLRIPHDLRSEALGSFLVTGFTLPFALAFGGMGSFLVAQHRQKELNLIRIPVGLLSHAGSAGVVLLGGDLIDLAWLNLALRGGSLAASWLVVRRHHALRFAVSRIELYSLLGMGSWMMVTNLLAPLATQLDRFLVGRSTDLASVAHYSTSMDLSMKVWTLLASLAPVLFPVLGELAARDPAGAARLFRKAVTLTLVGALPMVAGLQILGRDFLALWIGADFADGAWKVLVVLGSGVFVNLVSNLAFNLVQAFEGPRRTAFAHMVLVPLHLALLVPLLHRWGIVGAGIAFVVRYLVEGATFLWMARSHRACDGATLRSIGIGLALHGGALVAGLACTTPWARIAVVAAASAASGLWWLVDSDRLRLPARSARPT